MSFDVHEQTRIVSITVPVLYTIQLTSLFSGICVYTFYCACLVTMSVYQLMVYML